MVEDEDGKIRRNLMAICTALLVLAWLDVPLAAVAGRLLGEKPEANQYVLSPVKVWSATAALLFYFILRYRFSDEASSAIAALRVSQSERYRDLFWRHLHRLAKAVEAGTLPAGEFQRAIDDAIKRAAERQGRVEEYKSIKPRVRFGMSTETPNAGLDHNLTLLLQWDLEGQVEPNSTNTGVRYSMPPGKNKALHRSAWLYAAAYSRGSMALMWPVGLAALATVVVCWKLIRAVFNY